MPPVMKTYVKNWKTGLCPVLKWLNLYVLACFVFTVNSFAQQELDVIRNSWIEYSDASNSMYHHLSRKATGQLDERAAGISKINNQSQWIERQQYIRETLSELVGPFPEKTPLNPQKIRIIDKGKFRIEHIVFESLPGFYVTSSLYIPSGLKKRDKVPAVIYCSGHSEDGYRSPVYQHVIQNLVLKGFIVFAFDPVGQGERLEYFDRGTGKSVVGGPTKEHSYPGAQAFITGSSQAFYMIWDGIRAVDYLISRKEVDPLRIGITGRSGGGTQSAYIAAMDERIYAAAPENYITNYKRLFQSIGPQDAEQNIFNFICRGLDHPDFLIVRAPKPAMMITTTRDMFSIQGARETSREVSRIYKSYGKEEYFRMVEDDAPHESTRKNREAMYAFFQQFLGNPGNPSDEPTVTLAPEELQVTPTGQVCSSFNSETVYSLNRRRLEKLEAGLDLLRKNPGTFNQEAVRYSRKASGYQEPDYSDEPVFTGRIIRDGYCIEKYFIKGEGDYIIPYLIFKPVNTGGGGIIYLNPAGKSEAAESGGEIISLVEKGFTVLAPDLLGTGETGPGIFEGDANFDGASHNLWYASILTGQSITAILASDVIKLGALLKKTISGIEITGFAEKEMSPVMIHAAAFSSLFSRVILVEPLASYRSVADTRFYNPHLIFSTVAGALKGYDLPDLEASFAPGRLTIVRPAAADGNTTDIEKTESDMKIVRSGYKYKNADKNLKILNMSGPFQGLIDSILSGGS